MKSIASQRHCLNCSVTAFSNHQITIDRTVDILERNPMPLYRLIYKSTYTEPITTELLQSIEAVSKKNNAELDVTGILIGNKTAFMQVLEGDGKNVNEIFSKIRSDSRHTDVELISYDRIINREFSDWAMKCVATGIMGRILAERLKKKFGAVDSDLDLPSDGDKAFALLYDFAFLLKNGEIS
jgi:hypothetical protein